MEIIVAINSILLLFILAYMIRFIAPKKEEQPKPKLSKEDRKKLEEAKKSFENLMKYDEKQAMRKE